jgi:hypothetical protein
MVMFLLGRIAVVASICSFAVAAVAADSPQGKSPQPISVVPVAIGAGGAPGSRPIVLDATAGVPDLSENQAEIEALRRGGVTLKPTARSPRAPAIDAAREARRVAFAAIITAQDAKVRLLTDRLTAVPGGTAGVEIQKEIEREKLATSRLLLEAQLAFATRSGNDEHASRIKAALKAWDAPRPVLQPIDRPAPTRAVR